MSQYAPAIASATTAHPCLARWGAVLNPGVLPVLGCAALLLGPLSQEQCFPACPLRWSRDPNSAFALTAYLTTADPAARTESNRRQNVDCILPLVESQRKHSALGQGGILAISLGYVLVASISLLFIAHRLVAPCIQLKPSSAGLWHSTFMEQGCAASSGFSGDIPLSPTLT